MDVMLQNHHAKHICDVPDGLRELCADISREVMRSQPEDICCFIAEYLDALIITRENAKVAMKLVQNVVLRSEHIMDILGSTGLKLEEIAAAAPRLQKAFRAYLEAVDAQKEECGCDGEEIFDIEDECESTIEKILRETGATVEEANAAATKIQALFRGHFERLWLAQQRGEVRWQRAVVTTMEILRKLGITQNEATHAAIIIQSAYRGYYMRKTLKISRKVRKSVHEFDLTAWLKMMFEVTGLTLERANEAATVIQNAYRQHLQRKLASGELKIESTASHVIDLDKIASGTIDTVSEVKSDETVGSLDSDTSTGDFEVRGTKSAKQHDDSGATLTVVSTELGEVEKHEHPEAETKPDGAEGHAEMPKEDAEAPKEDAEAPKEDAEPPKEEAEAPKEDDETRALKNEAVSENAETPSEPRANEQHDEEKSTDGKGEDIKQDGGKSEDAKLDDGKSEGGTAKQGDKSEAENPDDEKSEG